MKFWLSAAMAAIAAPAWAAGALITNPDWERRPSGEELSKFWPPGVSSSGQAIINCQVTDKGTLRDCVLDGESPPGQGFGAAALRMSVLFKMKPATRDGVPTNGGWVRIPLNFTPTEGFTPPTWLRRPTAEEIAAVRPPGTRGTAGVVMLVCRLATDGAPKNCGVKEEAPKGKGFGAAALKLAPSVRFKPATASAGYTFGDITFPIHFPAEVVQSGVADFGGSLGNLSNAPWLEAPSPAEVAAAWPEQAPQGLTEGRASLRCGFSADGHLTGCALMTEDPEGAGFGAAALRLSSKFRLRGELDSKTIANTRVKLPFIFTNPKTGPVGLTVVTKPNWVSFISTEQMVSLYPAQAYDAHVRTGRGVVECVVAAGGALSGCKAASEDPAGLGFGEAAVAAAAAFMVNPWSDDGRPVEGARIRLPIRFVAADMPTEASPAASASAAPPR